MWKILYTMKSCHSGQKKFLEQRTGQLVLHVRMISAGAVMQLLKCGSAPIRGNVAHGDDAV